jgi:type III secretory pathway component EscV
VLGTGVHLHAAISKSVYDNHSRPVLAMEPEQSQNALTAVHEAVRTRRNPALIVEDPVLRPFMRSLIEIEFPNIPVFARAELPSYVAASLAGEVEMENEDVNANQNFGLRAESACLSATTANEASRLEDNSIPRADSPSVTLFVSGRFYSERARTSSVAAALAQAELTLKFFTMREDLFYELGLVVPEVHLERDSSLAENKFRCRLNETLLPEFGGLKSDEFLVNDTVNRLKLLSIEAREAVNPTNESAAAIVQGKTTSDACQRAGLTTWDAFGYLVLNLSAELRKHAAMFQTISVAQFIVDGVQPTFPRLVDALFSRFSMEQVNGIVQELLDEEISIRDLRGIFESLLSVNGTLDADLSRFIVFSPRVDNLCPRP